MSDQRRWRHVEIDFVADDDEAGDFIAALWAQVEDADRLQFDHHYGDAVCGACGQLGEDGEEHICDLAPTGESAVVSLWLLPLLCRIADLIDACVRLSTDQGSPRWIEIDEERIHWNGGVMRIADFREYYTKGADRA